MDWDFSDLPDAATDAGQAPAFTFDDLPGAAPVQGNTTAAAAARRDQVPMVQNPFGVAGQGVPALPAPSYAPVPGAGLDPPDLSGLDMASVPRGTTARPMQPSGTRPYQLGVAVRPYGDDVPYQPTGAMRVPGQGMLGAAASQAGQSFLSGTGGIVAGVGDVVQGGIVQGQATARAQLGVMDRIERGEAVPDADDPLGYGAMSSEQRAPMRRAYEASLQALPRPTDVLAGVPSALSDAGRAIQEGARQGLPVDQAQAATIPVQLAGALGGAVPLIGATIAGGPAGGFAVGALQGYNTTFSEAKAHGATDEQAHAVALPAAVVTGGLMTVDAAAVLRGLPVGLQSRVVQGALDYAGASGAMVSLNQVQHLADNAFAQASYDPERPLLQGVGDPQAMAVDALAGVGLHAGVQAPAAVRAAANAARRVGEPVMDPALRVGVAGMEEDAGRVNAREAVNPEPERAAGASPTPPKGGPTFDDLPSVASPSSPSLPPLPRRPRPGEPLAPVSGERAPDQVPANEAEPMPAAASRRTRPADALRTEGLPAEVREGPAPDAAAPITGRSFTERAPGVMSRLMADLGITREQAAGIVGNLGHESIGLTAGQQEIGKAPGTGGLGWAQWTGPRRQAFEAWTAERGLNVRDPEANYGFLLHELRGSESKALDALRRARTVDEATDVFQRSFERAGVVAPGSRLRFAHEAYGLDVPEGDGTRTARDAGAEQRGGADEQPGISDAALLAAMDRGEREADPDTPVGVPDAAPSSLPGTASFTTAKGSAYTLHEDGTTTRVKAPRPEHPGDEGLKPRSEQTLYLTQEDAARLAPPQGEWRILREPDGTLSTIVQRPDGRWGKSPSMSRVPVQDAPAVGLVPFELWQPEKINGLDAYRTLHPGNPIVSLRGEGQATGSTSAMVADMLAGRTPEAAPVAPAAPAPRAEPSPLAQRVDVLTAALDAFQRRGALDPAAAQVAEMGGAGPARRALAGMRIMLDRQQGRAEVEGLLQSHTDAGTPPPFRSAGEYEGADAKPAWAAMPKDPPSLAAAIRARGGIDATPRGTDARLPRGVAEMRAMDLHRQPGFLNAKGKTPERMAEILRDDGLLGDRDWNPDREANADPLDVLLEGLDHEKGGARWETRFSLDAAEAQRAAESYREAAQQVADAFGLSPAAAKQLTLGQVRDAFASDRMSGGTQWSKRDEPAVQRHVNAAADAKGLAPEVREARERLYRTAQAMMKFFGLPPEVGLRFVDRLVSDAHMGATADGSYDPARQGTRPLVTFALDTVPDQVPHKLFHEVLHGLMDPQLGLLSEGQQATLLRAADAWLAKGSAAGEAVKRDYPKGQWRGEAIARMGEVAFENGRLAQSAPGRVYSRLVRFTAAVGEGLRGRGFRTADDVYDNMLRGDRAAPGSREELVAGGPRSARRAVDALTGVQTPASPARQEEQGAEPPREAARDRAPDAAADAVPAQDGVGNREAAPTPGPSPAPDASRRQPDTDLGRQVADLGAVPDRYFARRPVKELTGEEIAPPSRPGRLQAVRQWAYNNLRGKSFRSEALGADVTVNKKGIEKPFSHGGDDILSAFAALPEMIRQGELVRSEPPRDPARDVSTKAWHTLSATVRIAGKDVPFALRVREDKAGHFFYDMSALRPLEEGAAALKAEGTSPEGKTDSGIAAAPDGSMGDAAPSGKDDGTLYARRPRDDRFKREMERSGQAVLPGAERTDQQAVAAQDTPLIRSEKAQRGTEGLDLFDVAARRGQGDLFERFARRFKDSIDDPLPDFGSEDGRSLIQRQIDARPLDRTLFDALRAGASGARAKLRDTLNQALFPMRQGSKQAQASAWAFANALRGLQYRYGRMDRLITARFSAADRARMGRALDEQSVFEQVLSGELLFMDPAQATAHERTAREAFEKQDGGLHGLSGEQRDTVEALNELARQTWGRLANRGLVEPQAAGLPYWMPRQFVMRSTAGYDRLGVVGRGGGLTDLNATGMNLTTRATNFREMLRAEDTEAVVKGMYGENSELVQDIRSLVQALAREERAIAGRDLVDALQRQGDEAGTTTVAEGNQPGRGFFTLDHPALWKVQNTGNFTKQGNPIYERVPLHIADEFKGPLEAVLSRPSPDWYKGLMRLKGGVMHAIMYSPFMHLMVEVGRAAPLYHGNFVALGRSMVRGSKAKDDTAYMDEATKAGLAPIGQGWSLDPATIQDEAFRSTSRLRPLEAYQKLHQRVLWDQVFNLQVGIYRDMQAKFEAKGFSRQAANIMAAHLANRYAGALPPEHLHRYANMAANVLMFSRSFTLGNLGVIKDMANGAPSHVRAAIEQAAGREEAERAQAVLRRKAIGAFVLDIGMFTAVNALAQAGFGIARNMGSMGVPAAAQQEWEAYVGGLAAAWHHAGDNPFGIISALRGGYNNEPGKGDRVYVGQDGSGRGIYARTALGKIGEEFLGYFSHPGQMLSNKLSPFARPLLEVWRNRDGLDRQFYRPEPHTVLEWLDNAATIAGHLVKSQFPSDQLGTLKDLVTGQAQGDAGVTAARMLLPLTGVGTISQGNPQGPAAGVQAAEARAQAWERNRAMPEARRLVALGRVDEAQALLERAIPDARGQAQAMRALLAPERGQAGRDRRFERSATDEARARRDAVAGGAPAQGVVR